MALSPEKERLCDDLLMALEAISSLLTADGKNPAEYKGLEKVKNIVRNHDAGGMRNITHYLDGDFRAIYDNRLASADIEKQIDVAYSVAEKL